jgi:hypothetical protein
VPLVAFVAANKNWSGGNLSARISANENPLSRNVVGPACVAGCGKFNATSCGSATIHRRANPKFSVAGESCRIAVDFQRTRGSQYLCRDRSRVRSTASHGIHGRRWAGVDATLIFARWENDRLRAWRRSRIEPRSRDAAESITAMAQFFEQNLQTKPVRTSTGR